MKYCEYCSNEHNGMYGSGRFCNTKCARAFSTKKHRKEINIKVSNTLKKAKYTPVNKLPTITKQCSWCDTHFTVRCTSQKIFCSNMCKQSGLGQRGGMKSYRAKRSKNEILFSEMCMSRFDNVVTNVNMFNGWDADIILLNEKIAILWNGIWHYEKVTKSHSLKQVQNRDTIKISEIQKAGYTPYIIKDMGKYNPHFVKTEFDNFVNHMRGA